MEYSAGIGVSRSLRNPTENACVNSADAHAV
jgi:hypothetical protein